MSWNTIVDGWGLQEVPTILARELCCSWNPECKGKLYTDQRLPDGGTPREYEKQLSQFNRDRVWCRFHATKFFED